jgi:D-alanyl-lipoteichoic acid acyltransferase DltB (MBOAT superfamily)
MARARHLEDAGHRTVAQLPRPFVTSPSQFWRHWHISLSEWLRDYLYIRSAATAAARG